MKLKIFLAFLCMSLSLCAQTTTPPTSKEVQGWVIAAQRGLLGKYPQAAVDKLYLQLQPLKMHERDATTMQGLVPELSTALNLIINHTVNPVQKAWASSESNILDLNFEPVSTVNTSVPQNEEIRFLEE